MSQERLMTIVLGPHMSEKAHLVGDAHNQVVFKVRRDANKIEIRQAVELLFDVKVDAVRVVNNRGKKKRLGAHFGRRKDWKKAYVSLAAGHELDFLGAE